MARRVQRVCVGGKGKDGAGGAGGLGEDVLEGREKRGEACRGVKRDVCTFGLTEERDNALQALRNVWTCVPVVGVAGGRRGSQGWPREVSQVSGDCTSW